MQKGNQSAPGGPFLLHLDLDIFQLCQDGISLIEVIGGCGSSHLCALRMAGMASGSSQRVQGTGIMVRLRAQEAEKDL